MPNRNLPAKFAEPIGKRRYLVATWNDAPCTGPLGCHRCEVAIPLDDPQDPGKKDIPGACCEYCGAPAPKDESWAVATSTVWNTESGELEPGCLFWSEHVARPWDNDPGPHLMAILPNGRQWDIDSRASNCVRKDDRTHRCWIRTGEPPMVTVGKSGDTCSAGAGSIQGGDWHGFLTNGEFREC